MRGFPLLNLLAVAGALLLMVIPLLRIDRPMRAGVVSPAEAGPAAALPVTVMLRFVHEPQSVILTQDGQPVAFSGTGLERQAETKMVASERSLELSLKATWPPGAGSTMVEVRVAPEAWAEQQQNVWAEGGAVDEIIRFNWRAKP
jgi:hypothetical protein